MFLETLRISRSQDILSSIVVNAYIMRRCAPVVSLLFLSCSVCHRHMWLDLTGSG